MDPAKSDDMRFVRACRVLLWSVAAVMALSLACFVSFLMSEAPLLYQIASGLFLLACALSVGAPAWLFIRASIEDPGRTWSEVKDYVGFAAVFVTMEGALYYLASIGGFALAALGVLAAVGGLALVVWLAWVVRRRIRRRLRQQLVQRGSQEDPEYGTEVERP